MTTSAASNATVASGIDPLPSGGLRFCLRNPALLGRWVLSRRFRRAVEIRKHVWKIRCFQKDELTPQALNEIDRGIARFDAVLKSGPSSDAINAGLKDLDVTAQKWLKPYANAETRENVEVFLVAIAVAMAIRTFFIQPFKIPTGSMQPTLFGVHFEDLSQAPADAVPHGLKAVYAALWKGDYYHEIIAAADGEVVDVKPHKSLLLVSYQDVVLRYNDGGRTYDKTHRVWFSPVDGHEGDLRGLRGVIGTDVYQPLLPGQPFKKGEVLLRLRDAAGDHLFVDRVTYNFRPPKRGEIVVFETRGIQGLPPDQFYIKRLVGLGGETLKLGDDRHLVVDGKRLDGTTPHFERVYGEMGPPQDSHYSGHVNENIARTVRRVTLAPNFPTADAEYRIPDKRYMVMGDNTLNSLDSRSWGSFPQTNVVGRYCFVWWPFTARWGTKPF